LINFQFDVFGYLDTLLDPELWCNGDFPEKISGREGEAYFVENNELVESPSERRTCEQP
jgi:hypothetical protein